MLPGHKRHEETAGRDSGGKEGGGGGGRGGLRGDERR